MLSKNLLHMWDKRAQQCEVVRKLIKLIFGYKILVYFSNKLSYWMFNVK